MREPFFRTRISQFISINSHPFLFHYNHWDLNNRGKSSGNESVT